MYVFICAPMKLNYCCCTRVSLFYYYCRRRHRRRRWARKIAPKTNTTTAEWVKILSLFLPRFFFFSDRRIQKYKPVHEHDISLNGKRNFILRNSVFFFFFCHCFRPHSSSSFFYSPIIILLYYNTIIEHTILSEFYVLFRWIFFLKPRRPCIIFFPLGLRVLFSNTLVQSMFFLRLFNFFYTHLIFSDFI